MTAARKSNGRFGAGNNANPAGRPKKTTSVNDTVMRELNASIVVTENQRRRSISKLKAAAKQLANKSASGDLRATKMMLDAVRQAESVQEPAPTQSLGHNDREIVDRFIARLLLTIRNEISDDLPYA